MRPILAVMSGHPVLQACRQQTPSGLLPTGRSRFMAGSRMTGRCRRATYRATYPASHWLSPGPDGGVSSCRGGEDGT